LFTSNGVVYNDMALSDSRKKAVRLIMEQKVGGELYASTALT